MRPFEVNEIRPNSQLMETAMEVFERAIMRGATNSGHIENGDIDEVDPAEGPEDCPSEGKRQFDAAGDA